MPLNSKALGATLGVLAIAAVTMAAPVFAQQTPPAAGQERPPDAQSPSGPPPQAAPVRPGSARSALVTANVNLRSGPGTDSEIITTIPGGSTVGITNCSSEWCAVTWNGRSGYAIARNLDTGRPRQVRQYRAQPRYAEEPDDESEPPVIYGAPGYYPPPPIVYGPGYYGRDYYGPGYYYGRGWGWRRRW
jgi:SH3 domain-containing protein